MRSKLILLFALLFLGLQANAYRYPHSPKDTQEEVMQHQSPNPNHSGATITAAQRGNYIPERPGQSRRDLAREPNLTYSQNQALTEAWHAGYHVGLPLAFTAIVYVESSGCARVKSEAGIAFGCSQVQVRTAYKVTGAHIPAWMLSDANLRVVNMAIGARYLQLCVDHFGWPVGAGCYEQGIPRTRILQRKGCFRTRSERIKPCLEVRRYMASVLAAMTWLKNLPMNED